MLFNGCFCCMRNSHLSCALFISSAIYRYTLWHQLVSCLVLKWRHSGGRRWKIISCWIEKDDLILSLMLSPACTKLGQHPNLTVPSSPMIIIIMKAWPQIDLMLLFSEKFLHTTLPLIPELAEEQFICVWEIYCPINKTDQSVSTALHVKIKIL